MDNEKIEKLFSKLCDITIEKKDSATTIYNIFEQAFDTKDGVEIFQIRTLIFQECLKVSKELGHDEDFFEEVFRGLSYKNLNDGISKVSGYFTNANKKLVYSNFRQYRDKQKTNNRDIDEIIDLNNDLKSSIENENLTPIQKKIIYEICEVVENIQQENGVVDDSEIKMAQESLLLKWIKYDKVINSIQNENIKTKIKKVYQKIVKLNNFMEEFTKFTKNINSIADNFKHIIDQIPSL